MIKVNYCNNGLCVSDFEAEKLAKDILTHVHDNDDIKLDVSTEYMLICFVLEVMEHRFDSKNIRFYIRGEEVLLDENLGLEDEYIEPYGFSPLSDKVLKAAIKNIRNNRKRLDKLR